MMDRDGMQCQIVARDLWRFPRQKQRDQFVTKTLWQSTPYQWPENSARGRLIGLAMQPAAETGELLKALEVYRDELKTGPGWLLEALKNLPRRPELEVYPDDGEGPGGGGLSKQKYVRLSARLERGASLCQVGLGGITTIREVVSPEFE